MPRPPYSSGTIAPRKPMSAIFWTSSVSKCSLRSLSRARGAISLSAKSRAVSRTSRCSSVNSKSIIGPERTLARMDEFGVFVFGAILVAGLIFWGIGKYYPGSGAEQVDWRPTRSPEVEAQLELEDVDQMLEAQNERRRRSGRPELTEDQVVAQVEEDERWKKELLDRYRRESEGDVEA